MAAMKNKPEKKVVLNSKDTNFLAVVAQSKNLPRAYLLDLAKSENVSPQALAIVEVIIDSDDFGSGAGFSVTKKAKGQRVAVTREKPVSKMKTRAFSQAEKAALDFSKWVADLK